MFQEVKSMLPVSGDDFLPPLEVRPSSVAPDPAESAEIQLPGEIAITRDETTGIVFDTSTLKDELILTAIATWCNMRIGNPPNYDNLLKAYESMKGSMRISSAYTTYGGVTE